MLLEMRQFLVKERVAFMKLSDTYDIYDMASGAPVGIAKEVVSPLITFARFLINKRLLPTSVEVRSQDFGPPLFTIKRGVGFLRTPVKVLDPSGNPIGSFRSKVFTLGGAFDVFGAQGAQVAEVKGDWKGWNFTFKGPGGEEIGKVTKKWAGIGKELFTSADNYVISLNESGNHSPQNVAMLLAAGLAVDVVYKEK